MRRILLPLLSVLVLWSAACGGTVLTPTDPNNLQVKGVVHYHTFEGGFWAIRGDDGTTYEPAQALPSAFSREGLRVWFEGRVRHDLGSIRMAGPIVDIVQIKAL